MLLSSGGMTKRLDRLADAGLIERRPDPSDRRGTLVRLTGRGKATIDRLLPIHLANEQQLLANEQQLLASLNSARQRTLDHMLRLLLGSLEPPQEAGRPQAAPHEDGPRAAPTQPVPSNRVATAEADRLAYEHRRGAGSEPVDHHAGMGAGELRTAPCRAWGQALRHPSMGK